MIQPAQLPDGWRWVTLPEIIGDDGVFIDGDWVESKDQDPDGDVRLIQLADIGEGEFIDKSARFLTASKAKELKCTDLEPGDVLIARMPDPLGRACIFPGLDQRCVTVVDVCIVRPDPRLVDARCLCRLINADGFRRELDKYIVGTTRQRISRGNLAKIQFPLPPLAEQKRIAAVLDKADDLRRKRREALATLDTLLQSVFLDMFGDPVTNPKGWPRHSLGALSTELYRYPTYYGIEYEAAGVPEVRGELLNEDGSIVYSADQLRFISARTSAKFPKTVLEYEDLVMSVRGTVGKVGLVPLELSGANITANLIRIAPNRSRVQSRYLYQVTRTTYFQGLLVRASSSTTISTIKAPDLKAISIPLPPLDLQRAFSMAVSRFERVRIAARQSLVEFNTLFAALQSAAFEGTLFNGEMAKAAASKSVRPTACPTAV